MAVSLDLGADVVDIAAAICDVESVSGNEKPLADAVESALAECDHLDILRDGDAIVARTRLGRPTRVVVAGHLDTVPIGMRPNGEPNFPTWTPAEEPHTLWGRGTVDMKGGVAVQLSCAAALANPSMDVTWIFYDHEEVDASLNGLGRLARNHPDVLVGDFAVLCEPTNGLVEGGCNGTIRVAIDLEGTSAHSARAWKGDNAIHKAADILARLRDHEAATVAVEGLDYRESLSAVRIQGGVAGNVIPDACEIHINYRFAPSKSVDDAVEYVRSVVGGHALRVTDSSPGARPGLNHPAAAHFVALTGAEPQAKVGWTDVSRFSALGTPAVNYGPGDPLLAHRDDEHVAVEQIRTCRRTLFRWLAGETHPDAGESNVG